MADLEENRDTGRNVEPLRPNPPDPTCPLLENRGQKPCPHQHTDHKSGYPPTSIDFSSQSPLLEAGFRRAFSKRSDSRFTHAACHEG